MSADKTRPSVFDESPNLTQFATKASSKREKPLSPLVREPRTYRSGRSATFATKTKPETLTDFYRIADEQGWKVGETFERAVELLVEAHKLSR